MRMHENANNGLHVRFIFTVFFRINTAPPTLSSAVVAVRTSVDEKVVGQRCKGCYVNVGI